MQPSIKIVGLKKYFKVNGGLLHAVDGIDLEIGEGRTVGVVGESGCGKSTLGMLVLRLMEPTSGQVLLNGENIFEFGRAQLRRVRQQMQIIFQDPFSSLNPRMSVFDIIAEPLRMNHACGGGAELAAKVAGLMDKVGLAERYAGSYPHEMDGGRRQRVGVARALALSPSFIVCDEPVSALDVSIQAQILNLLMDLQEQLNLTYMFISHDLSVVKHISDEIAVMYLGQCVERCPSDELFENPLHPYTKSLLAAIPVPKLAGAGAQQQVIRGEVSDPIDPKPGCRFMPRCDFCSDGCAGADIPLGERMPGHYVACRLYE
ncbi:MAG: ABC transporter ATP-binding protein [Clostridiales bacterium]|nr:ABC transporter ATP-binding protein [Clostridiales bacterium]